MCSVGTPDTDIPMARYGFIVYVKPYGNSRIYLGRIAQSGKTARTPTVSTHHTHHTDEYNRT